MKKQIPEIQDTAQVHRSSFLGLGCYIKKVLKASKTPSLVQLQSISKTVQQAALMADALGLSWTGNKRWKDVDAEETPTPAWATSAFAPLLEAILRETLRLHPAAPLVVRKLTSDVKSKDDIIHI